MKGENGMELELRPWQSGDAAEEAPAAEEAAE